MAFSTNTVVASAARTATGQSAALTPGAAAALSGGAPGQPSRIALVVNVTAVSGTTPSMTLTVQWSSDGTAWSDTETPEGFVAITATKNVVKEFTAKAAFYRLVWTISGTTPSFTFNVSELAFPR